MRQKIGKNRRQLLALGPILTLLVLVLPIFCGLLGTVLPAFGYLPALNGHHFTLDYMARLFNEPGLSGSVWLSFKAGIVATGLSLSLVIFFVAASHGTSSFQRLQALISPLLSIPHAAAAFGFAFLLAPSGMIVRLISPELTGWDRPPDALIIGDPMGLALIAGLVAKEVPFLLLVTLSAMAQVPVQRTDALARSLGYGRIAGFLLLSWPRIYPQIRLAVFAVIAFSSSVVDVAIILGPTNPPTLAVKLLDWMRDPDLSARFVASAGALLQLGVTLAAIGAWIILEKGGARILGLWRGRGIRLAKDGFMRGGINVTIWALVLGMVAGLGTLALWSFAGFWRFPHILPDSFTLKIWAKAWPRVDIALATTLLVAGAATLIATILAIICLLREDDLRQEKQKHISAQTALMLIYLPLIIPQIAFLFGLQFMFLSMGLDATLPALIITHLIFVLPYVFLSLSDPWRAFDRRFEAMAEGLGKSRFEVVMRIKLPLLMRAILVAMAIGFAVSIGQYLPTLLIGAGRLITITTEAVSLASGGNRRVIGVYAFLQMILPALGFALAALIPAIKFRRLSGMKVS